MIRRPLAFVIALLIVFIALAVFFAAVFLNQPKSPEQREQSAREMLAEVHASASATAESLLATGAFADFGVGSGGIRQVNVRIIDTLRLQLEIKADREILLASRPLVCLVGPYSAPDDAGLEDRCWGEPDLSGELEYPAGEDADTYRLAPNEVVAADVSLRRGDVRCDYAPGEWLLQVKLEPLVDGTPVEARYLDDVKFQVPLPEHGPLEYRRTDTTRFCGLATALYQQQGEPEIIE